MRDATFTITNLGMFRVDGFTPIVHLPQCAVLGVGRIVREPAVHAGAVVARDMITLSLTFDHRVVDGRRQPASSTRSGAASSNRSPGSCREDSPMNDVDAADRPLHLPEADSPRPPGPKSART